MTNRSLFKLLAVLLAAMMFAAACGSDADDAGDDVAEAVDEAEDAADEAADEAEDAADEAADEADEAMDEAEDAADEAADEAEDAADEAMDEEEDAAQDEGDEGDEAEEEPADDATGTSAELTGAPGEVGGSACGEPHGPYEDKDDPSGEVRVAWNDPLLSFNNGTNHGNATANANPLYLMHAGQFSYYDQDLNFINNDNFGICIIESLDPLTITYRINEGVTFSDGVQIDAADMMLAFGATSGDYNEENVTFLPDGSAIQTDEEGNWLVLTPEGDIEPEEAGVHYDPETFELFEGFEYIPAEGVNFDGSSQAYDLISELPTVSDDGLALTMVYDSLYVDYPFASPAPGSAAAHTVGRLAFGIDDPAEAKAAVLAAFQDNDTEALAAIAPVWNGAFDTDELPSDEGLYLSSGPYLLTEYTQREQMVFEANPDYTWGPQPSVQTIVYRIIGDPTAAVQALANEEIDVIQPQATADILTQLEDLADRGVQVLTGDTGTYEHVDLVFDNGGPFDPAAYGGDEETALLVRQALLKTIPRQDIVDRLIVPLNPNATPRSSYQLTIGAPGYDEAVAASGIEELYSEVDIEGAIALLEEAGVETPIDVRVHFAANNPRRANEYDLMAASAAEAGFNLIDGNSPTWGPELSDNSLYDMTFFGWQSTSTAVTGSQANYVTDGQNNYGHYSSQVVDDLYTELETTTDPDRQLEILAEVEVELVADAFGVPLFQFPAAAAYNSTYVDNVSLMTLSPTIFWNVWDWTAS